MMTKEELFYFSGDDFELLVKIRSLPADCEVDELIKCARMLKIIDQNRGRRVLYYYILVMIMLTMLINY